MKIETLREFLTLCEVMDYAEAAAKLFISESALSRHIQALEQELQIELFSRGARKSSLSQAGAAFIPYAQRSVAAIDEYTEYLQNEHATLPQLNIGFSRAILQYGLMDALFEFGSANRDIFVSLFENSSNVLYKMVRDGSCNFAFSYNYEVMDLADLKSLPVCEDSICAAVFQGHPLYDSPVISLEQLESEKVILPDKSLILGQRIMQMFQKKHIRPRVVMSVKSRLQILKHVSQGTGVALIEKKRFLPYTSENVRLIDITPDIDQKYMLFYRRGKLSSHEERFLSYITDIIKETA